MFQVSRGGSRAAWRFIRCRGNIRRLISLPILWVDFLRPQKLTKGMIRCRMPSPRKSKHQLTIPDRLSHAYFRNFDSSCSCMFYFGSDGRQPHWLFSALRYVRWCLWYAKKWVPLHPPNRFPLASNPADLLLLEIACHKQYGDKASFIEPSPWAC